jgi:hypothetical protein
MPTSAIFILFVLLISKIISLYQMINDDKLVNQFNTKKYFLFFVPLIACLLIIFIFELLKLNYGIKYNEYFVILSFIIISNLTIYPFDL